tara:strand:+ start:201 stop:716 length:516 start_codon:yes stop_codon:yes gene_type:complete
MFIPNVIIPDLRTDHAGETGAVFIYKGILLVSKDKEILEFAENHLLTEKKHLELIEKILPDSEKSKLLFLWKFLGLLTGLIPALIGKKFIYVTIFFVESFVEKHYNEQILKLKKNKKSVELIQLLEKLKNDEISHKEDSLKRFGKLSLLLRIWGNIVEIGSRTAVSISYKI